MTDPAGDGLNPYAYVGGNPVNAIDPLGLCALRMVGGAADIWAGGALIAGALSGPVGWGALGIGLIGGVTVLNGADNLIAGGRSAISGEYTRSFGEAAIHHYVQNDAAADLLYMGTQIGLGYAGMKIAQSSEAFTKSVIRVQHGNDSLLYSGIQQQRALAIVQEASQAAGVTLSNYVDDVVFTTGKYPFFDIINGRRVIALTKGTLRKTRAGQLIDAVHELSHARHSAKLGYYKYLNMYSASRANRGRIEILVESRAMRTVANYLGGLTPQQQSWSSRYIAGWR